MSRKKKTWLTIASLAAAGLLSYGASAFRKQRGQQTL